MTQLAVLLRYYPLSWNQRAEFKILYNKFPFSTYFSVFSFPTHFPLHVLRRRQCYGKWVVFLSLQLLWPVFRRCGIIYLTTSSAESFTVKPANPWISKWLLSFRRRIFLCNVSISKVGTAGTLAPSFFLTVIFQISILLLKIFTCIGKTLSSYIPHTVP